MFDLRLAQHATERFSVEVPGTSEPWTIGVIVGPSGSGKTTIAREAFKDSFHVPRRWRANRAIIDGFGAASVSTITRMLTAVGFSSPPAWLKPYAVLSNGERFRCDLARALLSGGELVVFDEFTSLVDRNVARISSAAISKWIRQKQKPAGPALSVVEGFGVQGSVREVNHSAHDATNPRHSPNRPSPTSKLAAKTASSLNPESRTVFESDGVTECRSDGVRSHRACTPTPRYSETPTPRFVAVTCHYDIIEWLEPDWVIDMATQTLTHRSLRRPDIQLRIARCNPAEWKTFSRHHYLSGDIHRSAKCFLGTIDGRPACFTAVLPFPHPLRPGWREHRTVCLPDFQGIGIGNAMSEFVASLYRATGRPYFSTTSHPAMIAHRTRSPLWRVTRKPSRVHPGGATSSAPFMKRSVSTNRITAGFEYVGPGKVQEARSLGLTTRESNTKE